jgi:hypothetical protein
LLLNNIETGPNLSALLAAGKGSFVIKKLHRKLLFKHENIFEIREF